MWKNNKSYNSNSDVFKDDTFKELNYNSIYIEEIVLQYS